jgi:hypothetical protein
LYHAAPHAVAGIKGERSSFAAVELQQTARLTWTPTTRTTAWGAVSRGVRTPVRIDEDLFFRTAAARRTRLHRRSLRAGW